jgi:signal peptidase I
MGVAALVGLLVAMLLLLRIVGLLRPFSMPTDGMAPTISGGDHIIMEGFTFLSRDPRRGDIVVFKTDGVPLTTPGQFFVKRVAGAPGDRVRISGGKLYINDSPTELSNAAVTTAFPAPSRSMMLDLNSNVTVPDGRFFVVGDNITNSFDSRYFGFVPRQNIIGRASFWFSTLHREGPIK